MKKLLFISSLLLIVSFACQKEVIRKNNNVSEEASSASQARVVNTVFVVVPLPGDTTGTPDITDPNNDPDVTKRRTKN